MDQAMHEPLDVTEDLENTHLDQEIPLVNYTIVLSPQASSLAISLVHIHLVNMQLFGGPLLLL
jgi:hypothetical protein